MINCFIPTVANKGILLATLATVVVPPPTVPATSATLTTAKGIPVPALTAKAAVPL